MFCISCGKINIKFLFIIIGFMITFILYNFPINFYAYYLSVKEKEKKFYIDPNFKENHLIEPFLFYLGSFLIFIFELIKNCYKNKKVHNEEYKNENEKKLDVSLIFNELSDENNLTTKEFIITILICLLSLVYDFTDIIYNTLYEGNNKAGEDKKEIKDIILENIFLKQEFYFIEFFFYFIISRCFFKIKYYKHQNISLLILILLGISKYTIIIFNIDNNNNINKRIIFKILL